jgi:hypothetical protein
MSASAAESGAEPQPLSVSVPVSPSGSAIQRSGDYKLGILRIEMHGSWSVGDMIQFFTQLEQAYITAGTLESLTESQTFIRTAAPREQTADDLIQAAVAFRLGGGLRIRSLQYGSPGFIEVIGALNPLKTLKDGITENRKINSKRDETALFDERVREKQAMAHEQAMEKELRKQGETQSHHEIEIVKLQLEAEAARFQVVLSLVDRLPLEERTAAAAQILQRLLQNTESLANDARLGEARMLEEGGAA